MVQYMGSFWEIQSNYGKIRKVPRQKPFIENLYRFAKRELWA